MLALTLVLLGISSAASADEEPEASHGVYFSISVFADFEASPTIDTDLPDLYGGNNGIFSAVHPETLAEGETFREIYRGLGESGTSLFEVDYSGHANLGSGTARVDLMTVDQNNASASHWTTTGSAGYWEWIELDGPTDTNGDYVVSFRIDLGPFTATNTQPPGFVYLWRATAASGLRASPLDTSYSALQLSTSALLKEECPTLAGPACWQIPRYTTASGEVKVPGSNPILRISHGLSVIVRTADGDAGGASMDMFLPAGVTMTSYQPVPEPAAPLVAFAALAALATVRRRQLP